MTEKVKWNNDGTDWNNAEQTDNVEIVQDKFRIDSFIPDSGDLQAHYDATEITASDGDTLSSWADQANNNDLSATGNPIYKTSQIGGHPIVRFDGTDDHMEAAFSSSQSQPNHIFAVIQWQTVDSSNTYVALSTNDTNNRQDLLDSGVGDFRMNAGSAIEDGSSDTAEHIWGLLFDGSNSTLRIDGTQVASGDVGNGSMPAIRVGEYAGDGLEAEIDVGEILVYPKDKSGIQSDVESYLSDKWGVAV